MNRRLFLTGSIGCGKSTILLSVLAGHFHQAGGFLTVRRRNAEGRPVDFVLMSPTGAEKEVFLDLSQGEPRLNMEVFSGLGIRLLTQGRQMPFVVLDEIGGIELLCPDFLEALLELLRSDVPCIGVFKSDSAASSLIRRLGLEEDYRLAHEILGDTLSRMPGTTLFSCEQYDKNALRLAQRWAEEYAHE